MVLQKYLSNNIYLKSENPVSFRGRNIYSRQISTLSSDPSSQSGSPSQCHRFGTHWPLRHTKSTSAQVFLTGVEKREMDSLYREQQREAGFMFFNKTSHIKGTERHKQ